MTPASTTSTSVSRDTSAGLPQLLARRADEHADGVALRVKRLGYWHESTWREYARRAAATGLGLRALGVAPGETVAILAGNRPEWLFADVGTQGIGAAVAGLHPATPPSQVARLLHHVGAVALIVEDDEQLDVARAIRTEVPSLRTIVVVDTRNVSSLETDGEVGLEEVESLGVGSRDGADVVRAWADASAAVAPDATARIVFSAGSEPPRAVVLSRTNLVTTGAALGDALGLRHGDETLASLPLSYVGAAVVAGPLALHTGLVVNFGEGPETFVEDAREVQPSLFVAVPRWWGDVRTAIHLGMSRADRVKRAVYRAFRNRGAADARSVASATCSCTARCAGSSGSATRASRCRSVRRSRPPPSRRSPRSASRCASATARSRRPGSRHARPRGRFVPATRVRRSRARRCGSRTTARCSCADRASSRVTSATTRARARPSTPTGGSTAATSGSSTTTAT
jgi:long-subunit acyl-CoA synthetase (AMP-forming)